MTIGVPVPSIAACRFEGSQAGVRITDTLMTSIYTSFGSSIDASS